MKVLFVVLICLFTFTSFAQLGEAPDSHLEDQPTTFVADSTDTTTQISKPRDQNKRLPVYDPLPNPGLFPSTTRKEEEQEGK